MPPSSRPNENDPKNPGQISPRPPIGGPPPKPGAPLAAKPLPESAKADAAATTAALPMVPGEETVWEKYSPNGEPFLSGLASFLIHIVLPVVLVILVGLLFSKPEAVLDELEPVERHFRRVAEEEGLPVGAPREYDETWYRHQVPGGMISNLRHQLKMLGKEDKMPNVLDEIVQVDYIDGIDWDNR